MSTTTENQQADDVLIARTMKEDDDRQLRNTLRNVDEIQNMQFFAFLINLFMGIKTDATLGDNDPSNSQAGLNSQEALQKLAEAFGVDSASFQNTVTRVNNGSITAFDAARETRANISNVSRADLNAAEAVIAKYAQTGNPLLETIASRESGGDYNRIYGAGHQTANLTGRTINEVLQWQSGRQFSAAGKYQIIRKTLQGLKDELGLSGNEMFDETMQDKMAVALLNGRGYEDYLNGDLSEGRFMRNLSMEWAALPKDMSGAGYYDNDGVNHAGVSPATILTAMRHVKDQGVDPSLSATFAQGGVEETDPEQPLTLATTFSQGGVSEVTDPATTIVPPVVTNTPPSINAAV